MDFSFFSLLLAATALTLCTSIWFSYKRFRDPFHPAVYLSLLLLSFYVLLPYQLFTQKPELLLRYLPIPELEYLQSIYLAGCFSLLGGCFFASDRYAWDQYPPVSEISLDKGVRRLAWFIGTISLSLFLYNIFSVGGFASAYGSSYGGGWSNVGYLREAFLFSMPAAVLYLLSFNCKRLTLRNWGSALLLISPLLIQGLLGARRGPTAMAVIALAMTWFLVRRRRPSLLLVLVGSVSLGFLLLFLVANRSSIYLGSSTGLDTGNLFNYFGLSENSKSLSTNEYVYSGGAILNADIRQSFFWGRRYFTIVFIRPIPRILWPTKYADAARFLNIPNLDLGNLGVGTESLASTVGWVASVGSAPGLFADLWIEFSWVSLLVLFGIGWFYGWAWQRMVSEGGFWNVHFLLASALSVYLISQTLEAMLFRYLLITGGLLLAWRYLVGKKLSSSSQFTQSQRLP